MNTSISSYKLHRFPTAIIQYAVWLYYRFNMSHRDIEDLLAERSIEVSYESIRLWCNKYGSHYARRLKRRHCGYGDTFYIDEVFIKKLIMIRLNKNCNPNMACTSIIQPLFL